MLESAAPPHLFVVDDENQNRTITSRAASSAQFISHSCLNKDELIVNIQTHLSQSSLPPPRGIAFLDGMVAPGSHGVELVKALDEAGYLVRRGQILNGGQADRAFLLAFLYSGGIHDSTMPPRLRQQLQDGLWTGFIPKPTNFKKIFSHFRVLALNNDPAAVQATLDYFDQKTQNFLSTLGS